MDDIKKIGPKDVFFQLLAIITLYFSAVNIGVLFFQHINLALPDPLVDFPSRLVYARQLIRWAVAALVVVFPVYVWVNCFLARDLKRFPEKKELRVRKWLLNLTLFAAVLVMIGDLVSLVYNYLSGEITWRFILKIAAVLLIAASVFVYYFWNLRREHLPGWAKPMKIFTKAVVIAATAVIISGFVTAGSPQTERLRRFDEKRVQDLQNIQSQIVYFWQQKQSLPRDLSRLKDSISGYLPPADPESKQPYEYRVVSDLDFELCADFKMERLDFEEQTAPSPVGAPPSHFSDNFNNWRHQAGRVCFQRKIDPELYKRKD